MAIAIHKPEFHADTGERKVGLAVHKVQREGEVVKLIFTNRTRGGQYLEPHPFYISRMKASLYPKRVWKGMTLIMIPLNEFKVALDEYVTEEDISRAQH